MDTINVVAAIIFNGNKVLIACRKSGQLAGLWEFPGGKIEKNETHRQCLMREIKEELNIEITAGNLFGNSTYTTHKKRIILYAYLCTCVVTMDFTLNAHTDVKWVDQSDIGSYSFAPADIPLVKKLVDTGF